MKKTTIFKSLLLALVMFLGTTDLLAVYSGTGTFTKITTLTDLTDGYYVIAYGTSFAMSNANAGSYFGNTAITPSGTSIVNPSVSIVWEVKNHADGGRTIYNEAVGKYVSYTGSSNAAYAVATIAGGSERWVFAISSSLFSVSNVTSTSRLLQYNTGAPRFACYTGSQQNITLYKLEQLTCTSSNLAFAQPSINKLAADAAFTQTATSLNGTTAIAYTSSNTGVATVNETTGEVSIVGAGSTIITASQAAGTHNAVDYCAAITTYTVNVAAAAPTITVTEISVPDMVAYAGETDTETMNVSGINLTENITLAISGTNANQFSLSTNSVSQTGGTAANTVVSIYYNPTTAGTHTATLTISSAGATTVTRTLTGTSTWAPLATPVATDATGVNNTGFIANWNAVAGATEYQLNVTTLTTGGAMASVLSENFAGFTAGSPNASADATDKSTALDGLTQTAGWTGSKVYQAGGAAKLGSSSALGYLVTPSVDLSGSFNVSFKAMAWSGDSAKVKIYLNDVLVKTVSGLTNDANYTMSPFSVDLTGGVAGSKIKFEGNQAAKGRVFLDDIVISSGGGVSEQPIVGSPFTVTGDNSKTLTGLTEGATYKYTVTAKNANVTSAVSNQISVTTTTGTGFEQLKNEFKVYSNNGNILLTTKAGNAIEVYNAVGQKLLTRTSVEGLNTITVSYRGVALIKVGNHVAKVIL